MRKLLLVIVCGLIFGGIHGNVISGILLELFEKYRSGFVNFNIGNITTDHLLLDNLHIYGLEDFKIVQLQMFGFNIKNLTIDFPEIEVEGSYVMNEFAVSGSLILSGAGSLWMKAVGLRLFIRAQLEQELDKFYLVNIEDIYAQVEQIQLNLHASASNRIMNLFMNTMLNQLATSVFNDMVPEQLLHEKNTVIKDEINKFLNEKQ